jgi:phosphoribosylformylglycinamidine synthase PurS subunit
MIARVIVTPKAVVNDPQGLTVKQGLASLGFREVSDVRVGKYIEVSLDTSSEQPRDRGFPVRHRAGRPSMKFGVVVFAPHEIFDFAGTPRRCLRSRWKT